MKQKTKKIPMRNNLVTVIVGEHAYQMTKEQANGLVDIGRQSVHSGVYAAKKKGVVILLNEQNVSAERFKELCKAYNKDGFVLHHNRGEA